MAFTNAILGATHAMSHPVGGMCDAPHGAINAVLLPHVIRFNAEADPTPYVRLADAVGIRAGGSPHAVAERFADDVARLAVSVGLPSTLRAHGVSAEHLAVLTDHAMVDACMTTNPRRPSRADVTRMYREAL